MSTTMVTRAHIDVLLLTGLLGPREAAGLWRAPEWIAHDRDAPEPDEDDPHRSSLVNRSLDITTADRVGGELIAENAMSVCWRHEQAADMLPDYVWKPYRLRTPGPGFRLTCAEALAAIAAYEYQACDHPDWPASEAAVFCEQLRRDLVACLPGFAESPQQWSDAEIERRRPPEPQPGRDSRSRRPKPSRPSAFTNKEQQP